MFLLNVVAVLVLVAVWMRWFAIEIVVVQDNGMAPTLVYGDQVLVWKDAMVELANVMVCEHPARPSQLVIGRVLAFAGHSVSTDRLGNLLVDDDRADGNATGHARFYDATRKKDHRMIVREMNYRGKHRHNVFMLPNTVFNLRTYNVEKGVYLLGDNRVETRFDSRDFGEVNPQRCLGQVFMIWKPAPSRGDDIDHKAFDRVE